MPLLHMTDRQRVANRANARKSTGPRSAEGKRASAQNGRARRLHSHSYDIPASWREPLLQRALDKSDSVADPVERRLHVRLWLAQAHFDLFFTAWNAMLDECQESNHCTRRKAQALLLTQPGAFQGLSKIYSRGKREVDQAIEALTTYRHLMANPAIPALDPLQLQLRSHQTHAKAQAAPASRPPAHSAPSSLPAQPASTPLDAPLMSRHASVGLSNSQSSAFFFPEPNPQLPWNQYPVADTYPHPLTLSAFTQAARP